MTKNQVLNGLLLTLAATVLFFQSGMANRLSKHHITVEEAMKSAQSGQATLVDVREKDEVAYGMIEGARWIPLSGLHEGSATTEAELAKLDRSKTVLLYCRSGNRSGKAATILEKRGFKVRNAGGYSGLISAGMKSTK
jgi:rhodanese-related sulfurtransferase